MAIHESVSRLYDDLFKENPRVFLRGCVQIKDTNWMPILGELEKTTYIAEDSFLFKVATDLKIDNKTDGQISLIGYSMVIAVGTDKYTNKPASREPCKEWNIYESFFARSPKNRKNINCKEKCPKFDVNNGEWCCYCHGHISHADLLPQLMHDSIDFQKIPKESIYYIQQIDTPDAIYITQAKQNLEQKMEEILAVEKYIDTFGERVKKHIEEEMAKVEEKGLVLGKLLSKYNGTKYGLKKQIDDLDKILRKIEVQKLTEEYEKIMLHAKELTAKIEKLK